MSEESSWLSDAIENGSRTKNHHWWPVALQSYWANDLGQVHILDSKGDVKAKKYKNRRVGVTYHGHTMHRGVEHWEHKYEGFFSKPDNGIHELVVHITSELAPSSRPPVSWFRRIFAAQKSSTDSVELIGCIQLHESFVDDLVLTLVSLLLRSPSYRHKLTLPLRVPGGEDIPIVMENGDLSHYFASQRWMAPSAINTTFVYAVFLWSDNVEFIFGDGLAQSILQSGNPDSPSGDCVVPLLPNLCVYLKTARSVRDGRNGCIFRANDDAVHHINKLTQIYSSHEIFYRSQPPRISEHFRRGEHLVVDYQKSWLFQRIAETIDAMRDGRELDLDQA